MNEVPGRYPGIKRVLFTGEQIAARVDEMAREIDAFYPPQEDLLVIGLLKGAFMLVGDLVRALGRPSVKIDFLTAALYGDGTDASREVRLLHDAESPIAGHHVLLIEDLVDTGKTLNRIGDEVARRAPRSLEVCVLLHKRIATDLRYEPRWVGFDAPREWLVGYGLDLGGRYRHLPFIGAVDPEAKRGT